jgi:hypothetical protein
MAQTLEQGDIFGKIGKGLGQGIAEQAERGRKAGILSKIGQDKTLGGADQAAQLIAAGYSPEETSQVLPLLYRQQKMQALKPKETSVEGNVPISSEKNEIKASENLLTHPEEITRFKQNQIQPITKENINNRAYELIATGAEIDPDVARSRAKEELQTDKNAQDEANANFAKDLNSRLALKLQRVSGIGGDSYQDVSGRIQSRLLDEGIYQRGVKGLTSEAAAEKVDKMADELSRANLTVKEASELPYSETKKAIEDYKLGKKIYDEYGFGEEYNDIVSGTAGITLMETAAMLDPLKNDSLKKALEIAGKPKFKIGFAKPGFSSTRTLGTEQMRNIIDKIKPGDNLLSIEHYLRDHRIDISEFKRMVREEKFKDLTPQQKIQLGKPSKNSFLGDIFFRTFK